MNKEKKTPEIRFKGFQDTWKQCKLGDVTPTFDYGLNAAATDYDGIHKYLRITDIDDDSHRFIMDGLTSPAKSDSILDKYQLSDGDICLARTGASVGKSYLYSPSDGLVYYAGFLIKLSVSESYDSGFIFQNTLTNAYKDYIKITSQRSGQPGVNAQEYSNYSFYAPSLPEQNQIGRLLKQIDSLIALQQKKYYKLTATKKSMLEKMFPKKGTTEPEIRFHNDLKPWNTYKVGEITRELTEYSKINSEFPLLTSSRNGLMLQNEFREGSSTDNSETLFSVVPKNACTYRHMSDDDIFHFNINTIVDYGLVSREYPVFIATGENDLRFIVYYLNSNPQFRSFCREQKIGGTRTRLYYKNLSEFLINVPSGKEQTKIANYFEYLDSLIERYHKKINKLKSIKITLLQKMFD